MSAEPKYARAIRVIGVGLVVTFIGVIPGTLLECRPFELYCMFLHQIINPSKIFSKNKTLS